LNEPQESARAEPNGWHVTTGVLLGFASVIVAFEVLSVAADLGSLRPLCVLAGPSVLFALAGWGSGRLSRQRDITNPSWRIVAVATPSTWLFPFAFFLTLVEGDNLVPLWLLLPFWLLPGYPLTYLGLRHRCGVGCCTKCGYNLTGNTSGQCPECGSALSNPDESETDDIL
jgi:hypothetical protein